MKKEEENEEVEDYEKSTPAKQTKLSNGTFSYFPAFHSKF